MGQTAISDFSPITQANISQKPQEIVAKLKEMVDSGQLRLRDISRRTSFGPATISQALSGSYEGDVEKLTDALTRFYRWWLANNAIIKTEVVNRIHRGMTLAWVRKDIGVIIGRFGRGKTKAVTYFAATNPFAVYVELSGVTSATELVHNLAESLGVEMHGSRSDKLRAVIRSLQRSPRLIIIDEADRMRSSMLALLQDIHGDGSERCAIVLVATEQFYKLILKPELGYLRRRIKIKIAIDEIEFKEAREIASKWPHDLDDEDLREAWSWSLRHFGVASLVNLLMRAYDVMQLSRRKSISSDDLVAAYEFMMD